MVKLYPYLSFINTKDALVYYEEVFGATNIIRIPDKREKKADGLS